MKSSVASSKWVWTRAGQPNFFGIMVLDADLVEARDLFKLERDLVPEQTINLPYGLALFYGLRGGMGMALDALGCSLPSPWATGIRCRMAACQSAGQPRPDMGHELPCDGRTLLCHRWGSGLCECTDGGR